MNKIVLLSIIFLSFLSSSRAQDREDFESYKKSQQSQFNSYKTKRKQDFEAYRRKRNEEFAAYLRQKWEVVNGKPAKPRPKEKELPPVVFPGDKPAPTAPPKSLPFDKVVKAPQPKPQPKPVDPIVQQPQQSQQQVAFRFFGTEGKVRIDRSKLHHLTSLKESAIADAWIALSEERYTNLVYDCLDIRSKANLCDWAYLKMVNEMATAVCGSWNNDAKLLAAYVFCQSGYKVRLAKNSSTLFVLYASEHTIYDATYFYRGGTNYYLFDKAVGSVQMCDNKFPGEKSLSLSISAEQQFALSATASIERKSSRYPSVKASYKSNSNLVSFFESYPESMIGDDPCTRWAMFANTPMSKYMREQLYPQLKVAISGKTELQAVDMLLNWVQTGFDYKKDIEVWGVDDRVFFAEESLNYPYCDCEDRAILFTRLVRDLVGLKCILVYYPGHLAAAVQFTSQVNGDYIMLNGSRFVIADPTYINASVGLTMRGMDNSKASVILLQ